MGWEVGKVSRKQNSPTILLTHTFQGARKGEEIKNNNTKAT